MGQFIVKLHDTQSNEDFYLLWSTNVDAPIVVFEDRDDIATWTKEESGNKGLEELPARLARVDVKGTSSLHDSSAQEVIAHNFAGRDGTCLSEEQIIQFYWRDKMQGEPPIGKRWNPETGEYDGL